MKRTILALALLFLLASIPALAQFPLQNPAAVSVGTAGTRAQLTTDAKYKYCRSLYIEADDGNTGVVFVGDINVSSTRYASSLAVGEGFSWSADVDGDWIDVTTIYLDVSVSTETAQWSVTCSP